MEIEVLTTGEDQPSNCDAHGGEYLLWKRYPKGCHTEKKLKMRSSRRRRIQSGVLDPRRSVLRPQNHSVSVAQAALLRKLKSRPSPALKQLVGLLQKKKR